MQTVESTWLQESSLQSHGVPTSRSNPATVQYTKGQHIHYKEDEKHTHTHIINQGERQSILGEKTWRLRATETSSPQVQPNTASMFRKITILIRLRTRNSETHTQSHCGETVESPDKWKNIHTLDLSCSSFCRLTKKHAAKNNRHWRNAAAVTMHHADKTRAEAWTPEALESSAAVTGINQGADDVWRSFSVGRMRNLLVWWLTEELFKKSDLGDVKTYCW